MQVCVKIEIFLDAQILIQPEALRHIADAILDVLRLGDDIEPHDFERTLVRHHQSGGQPDERGLARAIRAHERGKRAVAGLQRDAVEGLHHFSGFAAESLADRAGGQRHVPGRMAHDPFSGLLAPPAEIGLKGRTTVAGMPSRRPSVGSLTKTRTS